jgi:hypothetical protein
MYGIKEFAMIDKIKIIFLHTVAYIFTLFYLLFLIAPYFKGCGGYGYEENYTGECFDEFKSFLDENITYRDIDWDPTYEIYSVWSERDEEFYDFSSDCTPLGR